MPDRGLHRVRVTHITEFPPRHRGEPTLWEICAEPDVRRGPPRVGTLTPWSYYTQDPTVADTAQQALDRGVPLRIAWQDDGAGQRVDGCEIEGNIP